MSSAIELEAITKLHSAIVPGESHQEITCKKLQEEILGSPSDLIEVCNHILTTIYGTDSILSFDINYDSILNTFIQTIKENDRGQNISLTTWIDTIQNTLESRQSDNENLIARLNKIYPKLFYIVAKVLNYPPDQFKTILVRKLGKRPDATDLRHLNILKEQSSAVDPAEAQVQRRHISSSLEQQLGKRSDIQRLKAKGVFNKLQHPIVNNNKVLYNTGLSGANNKVVTIIRSDSQDHTYYYTIKLDSGEIVNVSQDKILGILHEGGGRRRRVSKKRPSCKKKLSRKRSVKKKQSKTRRRSRKNSRKNK